MIIWDDAPEGATHYDPTDDNPALAWIKRVDHDDGRSSFYFNDGAGVWCPYDASNGLCAGEVSQYIAKPSTPTEPKSWNGEGLPPVGTKCQVLNTGFAHPSYEVCEILFFGLFIVVYTSESCTERSATPHSLKFKPLDTRTDEQKAIDDITVVVENMSGFSNKLTAKTIFENIKAGNIHKIKFTK